MYIQTDLEDNMGFTMIVILRDGLERLFKSNNRDQLEYFARTILEMNPDAVIGIAKEDR